MIALEGWKNKFHSDGCSINFLLLPFNKLNIFSGNISFSNSTVRYIIELKNGSIVVTYPKIKRCSSNNKRSLFLAKRSENVSQATTIGIEERTVYTSFGIDSLKRRFNSPHPLRKTLVSSIVRVVTRIQVRRLGKTGLRFCISASRFGSPAKGKNKVKEINEESFRLGRHCRQNRKRNGKRP